MEHLECKGKGEVSITEKVETTYKVMFWFLVADIFMLLCLYHFSTKSTLLGKIGVSAIRIAEITLGMIILSTTIRQLGILKSKSMRKCMIVTKEL